MCTRCARGRAAPNPKIMYKLLNYMMVKITSARCLRRFAGLSACYPKLGGSDSIAAVCKSAGAEPEHMTAPVE